MEANDISQWANKQKELLLLESDSEKSQLTDKISLLSAKECEERGLSLLSLSISSTTTALFGRCCVSLVRSNNKLLARSFKVGDEVVLYCPKLRNTPEFMTVPGIVSKIQALSINIICDEIDESVFDSSIRVDLRANNSTFQKYQTVLGDIQNTSNPIVNLLFAHKDQQPFLLQNNAYNNNRNTVRSIETLSQELINPNLNLSQIKAVFAVLEMKQISVIHGPPGTGKTSTVVELIQQSAKLNLKVLVCAPSNIAVDNILERLVIANKMILSQKLDRKKLGLVRLGHPARVSQSTAKYCLDALIANDDGTDIVSDIREEIEGLRKELLKCRNGNRRKGIQSEIRILSKESRNREDKIVKSIIKHVDVVLCTCVTASSRLLRDTVFDIVIIDEAAQALEVSCWIPMLMSNRCVLVGDHNQLPPTVKSPKASSLSLTLFEKIIKNPIFSKFSYLLDIQYRMNDLICKWSSKYMYGGQLISHKSVASRTIKAIQNGIKKDSIFDNDTVLLKGKKKKIVEKRNENDNENENEEKCLNKGLEVDGLEDTGDNEPFPVMLVLDTTGCDMYEESCNEGSKTNYAEAEIVLQHVLYLLDDMKVKGKDIGVITPYNGQLEVLRQIFASNSEQDSRLSDIEVKTIDGYQGGEKECIVMSMVRSNLKREIGFLGDKRRINVAVTRARVHIAIVCDVDTCSSDPFICDLLEHMSLVGEQRSVFEMNYPTSDTPPSSTNTSTVKNLSGNTNDKSSLQSLQKSFINNALKKQNDNTKKQDFYRIQKELLFQKEVKKGSNLPIESNLKSTPQIQSNDIYDINNDLRRLIDAFIKGILIHKKDINPVDKEGNKIYILSDVHDIPEILSLSANGCSDLPHDKPQILRFPLSMDHHGRRMIHKIAEEYGLFHRSIGELSSRYIEISLTPFPVNFPPNSRTSKTVQSALLLPSSEVSINGPSNPSNPSIPLSNPSPTAPIPSDLPNPPSNPPLRASPPSDDTTAKHDNNTTLNNDNIKDDTEKEIDNDMNEISKIRAAKYLLSKEKINDKKLSKKTNSSNIKSDEKKEKKGKKGGGGDIQEEEVDELEALQRAIQQNQDVAFQNQHRASPFPNPFITANDCNKTKLQGIINGAEALRNNTQKNDEKGVKNPPPKNKKILKKPPKKLGQSEW